MTSTRLLKKSLLVATLFWSVSFVMISSAIADVEDVAEEYAQAYRFLGSPGSDIRAMLILITVATATHHAAEARRADGRARSITGAPPSIDEP